MTNNVPVQGGAVASSLQLVDLSQSPKVSILDGTTSGNTVSPASSSRQDPRMWVTAAAPFNRPANTTEYAANTLVANSTIAGSVAPIVFATTDTIGNTVSLEQARIATTDTGFQTTQIRLWLYAADPTLSTGVINGDGSTFSTKQGAFLGTMTGTFKTFNDGAVAVLSSDVGTRILTYAYVGTTFVYGLLQTLGTPIPLSASTFTATLVGTQGRP
jgi:hypothetical protein